MGTNKPQPPDEINDIDPPIIDADAGPTWMQWMVRANGIKEYPGEPNNPMIMRSVEVIAERWPDMAAYAHTYQEDATPWCGQAVAWSMTKANVRPPKDYLSSKVWRSFGFDVKTPEYGCIVCLESHVALFHHQVGSTIYLMGGNQSDMVNLCPFNESEIVACRWPDSGDYEANDYVAAP
jgi:uncharacterized protein (TIGR02594 family)